MSGRGQDMYAVALGTRGDTWVGWGGKPVRDWADAAKMVLSDAERLAKKTGGDARPVIIIGF